MIPDDQALADLKALLIRTLSALGDVDGVVRTLRERGLNGCHRAGLNPIAALMRELGAPAATAFPDELGFQSVWLGPPLTFKPSRGVAEFLERFGRGEYADLFVPFSWGSDGTRVPSE